jgi:ubiquinone/menaquinone biosynthesis C-methylase UbiE
MAARTSQTHDPASKRVMDKAQSMEQPGLLVDYYAKRAREYDRIYEKPERQEDLARLRERVREVFRGAEVLEIACGTGYWTEVLAEVAQSVTAVDINESVLAIARGRRGVEKVRFVRGDVYDLGALREVKDFGASACLCGFWWSHMPKERIGKFLAGLHRQLKAGATVMFMDNTYVASSSTLISRTDAAGNTYQTRKLEDGSTFEVLKNFPTEEELRGTVAGRAEPVSVRFEGLRYYWVFTYRVKAV